MPRYTNHVRNSPDIRHFKRYCKVNIRILTSLSKELNINENEEDVAIDVFDIVMICAAEGIRASDVQSVMMRINSAISNCIRDPDCRYDKYIRKGLKVICELYSGLSSLLERNEEKAASNVLNGLEQDGVLHLDESNEDWCKLTINSSSIDYYLMRPINIIESGQRLGKGDICPLGSWIKGHMRLLLHKLITFLLVQRITTSSKDYGDLLSRLLVIPIQLLIRDDEELMTELMDGDAKYLYNMVSIMLGAGGWSSPLVIRLESLKPEDSGLCTYRVYVDRVAIAPKYALLMSLFGSTLGGDETYFMLERLNYVLPLLLAYFSSAPPKRKDVQYRFLPLTARYPVLADQGRLPERVVESISLGTSTDDAKHALETFFKALNLYVDYVLGTHG